MPTQKYNSRHEHYSIQAFGSFRVIGSGRPTGGTFITRRISGAAYAPSPTHAAWLVSVTSAELDVDHGVFCHYLLIASPHLHFDGQPAFGTWASSSRPADPAGVRYGAVDCFGSFCVFHAYHSKNGPEQSRASGSFLLKRTARVDPSCSAHIWGRRSLFDEAFLVFWPRILAVVNG